MAHNTYQHPGGEDTVFESERGLLERNGHQVFTYKEDNNALPEIGLLQQIVEGVWSKPTHDKMTRLIENVKPSVVHFHNIFFRISPSAYSACRDLRVPVVQTLHNFRLLCPAATFYRDGRVCENCLGKAVPWPGVLHRCYRHSSAESAYVAALLTIHRNLKTWSKNVDIYVALTEFQKNKFVEAGFAKEKIAVKSNFVSPDPGEKEGVGTYGLFVGRLTPEKGLETLIAAHHLVRSISLNIVGDGSLRQSLTSRIAASGNSSLRLLGSQPRNEVFRMLHGARFLVFPSEWYEGFPMIIAEAFACGVPVIASRLGSMAEIVEDGRTGLLFNPGDAEDLASKMDWASSHDREMADLGHQARIEYENKYTAQRNYQVLMQVYQQARQRVVEHD